MVSAPLLHGHAGTETSILAPNKSFFWLYFDFLSMLLPPAGRL
jgi:hypothetical protein